MSKVTAPLVAFAYLAETAHESGHNLDLIAALAPLLGIVAGAHEDESFQPTVVAKELRERFGLRVNPYAVEQWIPQLKAAGIVKSTTLAGPKNGKQVEQLFFAKPEGALGDLNESDVDELLQKFKDYATPKLARVGRVVSDVDLENFFLKEIADLDFLAAVLRTNKQDRHKASLTLNRDPVITEASAALGEIADLDVLCAGFFLHAADEDPSTFDRIVKIASGAVIFEVLFDVGNPQTDTSFDGQAIILDGPICIKALGLNSKEDEEHMGELLRSVSTRGGKLAVFEHTVEEVRSLLSAALKGSHEPWGYGPTVRRIRQDRNAEIVARGVLADVESALRAINVKTVLSNPTTSAAWALLPQSREEQIAQRLAWYENPDSRSRDAASLAATYRLRGGFRTSPKRVHETRYIFLTENSRLVDVAYGFFSQDPDAPIAVTDRYLAGYLFVMCGGADDITGLLKKRVMANCSNAVAPRTDLIEKMAGFVEKLDDAQRTKYTAMMTDGRAARYLTEITFGNTGYLQADNFESVLGEIYEEAFVERNKALTAQRETLEADRMALVAEMAINHEKEVSAVQQEKARALNRIDEELNRLKQEQQAREATQIALDVAQAQLRTTLENAASDAFSLGGKLSKLLYAVYALAAIGVAFLGDTIAPSSQYRPVYYVVCGILVLVALHRVPHLLIERPRMAFVRWLYNRTIKKFGLAATAYEYEFDPSSGRIKLRLEPETSQLSQS